MSNVSRPFITIFRRTEFGISQNNDACSEYLKIDESVKVLHNIKDATRGHGLVNSANFWPKNPPNAAPKT